MADTTLKMTFNLENGRTTSLSLADPKADLTEAVVRPVMESMVAKDALRVNGNKIAAAKTAVSRKVEEQELF